MPSAVNPYNGKQTGMPGYQPPQTGYPTGASGYQPPQIGGYQASGTPGYQQPPNGGYQGAGYFTQPPATGPYTGAAAGGGYTQPSYSPPTQNSYFFGGMGSSYASPASPPVPTGASYIPPTPYSTGNTSPDYPKMQIGYQAGYSNSISQMGRAPQSTTSRQMPLNGGGYTPERVRVKRRPFEVTDSMVFAAGGLLILLFILAVFAFNSTALRILFLIAAVGTTAALWIKPLTAENRRLCYTIVALALCIATVVKIIVSSGGQPDQKNSSQNQTQQQSGSNSQGSGSNQGGSGSQTTPGTTSFSQGMNYDYGQTEDSDPEDEVLKQRLMLFLQYWNANRLDEMLTLCAPSWVSKQESPKTSLFQILKNRVPVDFEFVELQGTSQDKSRIIIIVLSINRHTGTGTVTADYQTQILMLKEGEQWYVDPPSIQTNIIDPTPDPNVTPTPAPTPEPQYDANTVLYYNPDGGSMYHLDPNCVQIHKKYLPLKGHFTYGEINDPAYAKLEPCNVCNAPLR